MADPVTAAALVSTAQSGLKVGGSLIEGQAKNNAAKVEALKMQTAASDARLRAKEIDGAYTEELSQTLSNLRAIRTAQNASIDSPTSLALEAKATEASQRQSERAVKNELRKATRSENDAVLLRTAGKAALGASYIKVAGDAIGFLQGANSLAQPKKP